MQSNKSIINIIIKKRDEDNLTFQEISNYIDKEYGIKKTRQSIYSLYKRHKDNVTKDDATKAELEIDVLNLFIMGYSINKIASLIGISNYKVKTLIENEENEIKNITNYKMQMVLNKLQDTNDINEIKNILKYKNWEIQEKGLNEIVSTAITMLLEKQINNMIAKLKEKGVNSDTLKRSIGVFKNNYTIPLVILQDNSIKGV